LNCEPPPRPACRRPVVQADRPSCCSLSSAASTCSRACRTTSRSACTRASATACFARSRRTTVAGPRSPTRTPTVSPPPPRPLAYSNGVAPTTYFGTAPSCLRMILTQTPQWLRGCRHAETAPARQTGQEPGAAARKDGRPERARPAARGLFRLGLNSRGVCMQITRYPLHSCACPPGRATRQAGKWLGSIPRERYNNNFPSSIYQPTFAARTLPAPSSDNMSPRLEAVIMRRQLDQPVLLHGRDVAHEALGRLNHLVVDDEPVPRRVAREQHA